MVSSPTTEHPQDSKVLVGWKEIANFLGVGTRTAQRYARKHGLPVRRPAGKSRGPVRAAVAELEAWLSARPVARRYQWSGKPGPLLAWEGFEARIGRMRRLMDETDQLKNQITARVTTLHSNIHLVGRESKALPCDQEQKQEQENDALEDLGSKKQFKLLSFDNKVRTAD